mmetsp:Transcript_128999/g.287344  ORF Transcript_128999/g.287344 Transcript_128999/m.287344 type:complete len:323 (-) Transcript_128999:127-1095(-)
MASEGLWHLSPRPANCHWRFTPGASSDPASKEDGTGKKPRMWLEVHEVLVDLQIAIGGSLLAPAPVLFRWKTELESRRGLGLAVYKVLVDQSGGALHSRPVDEHVLAPSARLFPGLEKIVKETVRHLCLVVDALLMLRRWRFWSRARSWGRSLRRSCSGAAKKIANGHRSPARERTDAAAMILEQRDCRHHGGARARPPEVFEPRLVVGVVVADNRGRAAQCHPRPTPRSAPQRRQQGGRALRTQRQPCQANSSAAGHARRCLSPSGLGCLQSGLQRHRQCSVRGCMPGAWPRVRPGGSADGGAQPRLKCGYGRQAGRLLRY